MKYVNSFTILMLLSCGKLNFAALQFDAKLATDVHNNFRRLQIAADMKIMEWDQNLAEAAGKYIEQCIWGHDPNRGKFGENLYVTSESSSIPDDIAEKAIQSWYNEINDYDLETNICYGTCGHYTQVVWADSYSLGCAAAYCKSITGWNGRSGTIFICRYGPPGNYAGQKPFGVGQLCSQCDEGWDYCHDGLCSRAELPVEPPPSTHPISTDQPITPSATTIVTTSITTPQTSASTNFPVLPTTTAKVTSAESPSTATRTSQPYMSSTTQTTTEEPKPTDCPTVPKCSWSCSKEYEEIIEEYNHAMKEWKEAFQDYKERYGLC